MSKTVEYGVVLTGSATSCGQKTTNPLVACDPPLSTIAQAPLHGLRLRTVGNGGGRVLVPERACRRVSTPALSSPRNSAAKICCLVGVRPKQAPARGDWSARKGWLALRAPLGRRPCRKPPPPPPLRNCRPAADAVGFSSAGAAVVASTPTTARAFALANVHVPFLSEAP